MSHRKIVGLKWARVSQSGPDLPIRRARGARAAGLRYERAVAAALPIARHGQWWEYEDLNGHGWCQTDLILTHDHSLVILEVKYSWVEQGHLQIEELYSPVVEMAMGKRPLGVQVCKNLKYGVRNIHSELSSAVASGSSRPVLHYLGTGPLLSRATRPPLPLAVQLALDI